MGKFSFGKKDKDKDKASQAQENPYAQPPSAGDPYARAKIQAGVAPAPPASKYGGPPALSSGGYGAMGGAPPPQQRAAPSYGSGYGDNKATPSGYGDNKYGNAGGYGQNKYESSGSKYGAGGYGGLGGASDEKKNPYGDTKSQYGGSQAESRSSSQTAPPAYSPNEFGNGGGSNSQAGYGQGQSRYGGDSSGSYGSAGYGNGPSGNGGSASEGGHGAYQDRQLTAEEEEEEDVQAVKEDIRQMKREDVSATRNALRLAAQAEETGRNTLARLGAQGEKIHNTEKNLDLAANNNLLAEQKAAELKTLNKSMFAVHVSNPFTGAERRRKRDEEIMKKHHDDRDQREQTRQAAWEAGKRMEDNFNGLSKAEQAATKKTNLAERAKYQFEADSEDEGMENEIDDNLQLLSGAAGRLNALARATGKEVEEQNKHLDRIAGKSDFVDDQIHMNRARLDRIH